MELVYSPQAEEDRAYWKSTGNQVIMQRISKLLADIAAHPYEGIGKPEPLKYDLSGCWSRRINSEHRIVYRVHEDKVEIMILALRYHYIK